jgi:hypothetical protein
MSYNSSTTTYKIPDSAQQELEDLQQLIQQIRAKNAWIQKENNLFSSYIRRFVTSTPKTTTESGIESGTPYSLNPEQRFIIATSELKETRDEIDRAKEDSERFLEQLRVRSYSLVKY